MDQQHFLNMGERNPYMIKYQTRLGPIMIKVLMYIPSPLLRGICYLGGVHLPWILGISECPAGLSLWRKPVRLLPQGECELHQWHLQLRLHFAGIVNIHHGSLQVPLIVGDLDVVFPLSELGIGLR
jgi:hypothetical protein